MNLWDETWFGVIRHPARYIGEEIHAVHKDPSAVEVSVALAFPDVYEVGMSHLGLKILYTVLNRHSWIGAERVFAPWVDLEEEMRSRHLPLRALESGRPLSDFDLLGFSLQHELTYTNVLTMLNLSGIPFLAEERDLSHPLVIAGGPACFNPEPVAPLFDAIVIGDGEEAAVEICRILRGKGRRGTERKEDLLHALTQVRGVYVPLFFKAEHGPDGRVSSICSARPGYEKVRKAITPALERASLPISQVVPYMELVHDRLTLEVSRGCTRGCRFCQAGMIYRPVRERNPQAVLEAAVEALKLTGYDEVSLLSLSSGDYSCLGPLLRALMDRFSAEKVAVSLPSLRVDSLDPCWFEEIKRVRKTGFTLAAEAGNDRLRRVINKGLSNEEILKTAGEVYRAGWNLIKLYFMIGLPQEEERDIEDISELARAVERTSGKGGARGKLNVSVATFVPKSHTPFMWEGQISLEESRRRIQKIRSALGRRRIHVKWNPPEMSWLEGIFSRGDRRLNEVLVEAWQMGARFDAWTEHFNAGLWEQAFQKCGLDPAFYLHRERPFEEILPWSHIDCGVSVGFLHEEREKAMRGEFTPDCRKGCLDCGVCDHSEIRPILQGEWLAPPVSLDPRTERQRSGERKYRVVFTKVNKARYLSHLELLRLFSRAFKRAGIPVVHSSGYHPMPKISFHSALPVGVESLQESFEVRVAEPLDPASARERLERELPEGVRLPSIQDVTEEGKKPVLRESHYELTVLGVLLERRDMEGFLQSDSFPVVRKGRGEEKTIDARPLVKTMCLIPPHGVSLVLSHGLGAEPRPTEIVQGVFHLSDEEMRGAKVLKTGQVMY